MHISHTCAYAYICAHARPHSLRICTCMYTHIHTHSTHAPPHKPHRLVCTCHTHIHTHTYTHIHVLSDARTHTLRHTLAPVHGPPPWGLLAPLGGTPSDHTPWPPAGPVCHIPQAGPFSLLRPEPDLQTQKPAGPSRAPVPGTPRPPPHTQAGEPSHTASRRPASNTRRVWLSEAGRRCRSTCAPRAQSTLPSQCGPSPDRSQRRRVAPCAGPALSCLQWGTPHPSSTRPPLSDQSGGGQVTVPFQVVIVALTRVPSKDTGPPPAPTVLAERPAPSAEAPENRGHGHVLGHGLAPSPPGPCVKKPWAVFRPVVRAPGGGEGDNLFLVNHHQNFSAGC